MTPAIPAGEITVTKTGPGKTPGEDTFLITCGDWKATATREQLSQLMSRCRSQFIGAPGAGDPRKPPAGVTLAKPPAGA